MSRRPERKMKKNTSSGDHQEFPSLPEGCTLASSPKYSNWKEITQMAHKSLPGMVSKKKKGYQFL